ncbi:MAG: exosortase A [Rhodoferax sp.]|nr:exosortase A [Rhodoferax sp.]
MNSIAANPPDFSTTGRTWRFVLPAFLALLAWVLFLYRDTGIAMVTIWARSETFTHGFLVPPIVLWLIWRQRQAIAAQQIRPALWLLLPVACMALVWLLGDLAAVNAVTQLALVALLISLVPAVLGMSVARQIMFPLGFLFFAVPIGEFVMPQLMAWTADFTVFALRLSGVPVYREGLQFVIPSGNWSVVEACSGVRYLIASITVGTLFAYLNYQSTKRRILFVIVSILVPVVANWLRAYMIVMLGHFSGNKLAVGVDHLVYGWVFFGVVIMLMFIIGARWSEPEKMTSVGPSGGSPLLGTIPGARVWAITAGFAAVLALPQVALWLMDQGESAKPVSVVAPAALTPEWQAVASPVAGGFKPSFQNPSAEINRTYESDGRPVGLYLGYYRHQNYDRKLVSSNNSLVPSNDPQWAQVAVAGHELAIDGKSVVLRSAELRGTALAAQAANTRLTVWQIYWINGTLTSSDYLAKAYSALYRLTGRGDDSAVIIVYTPKDAPGGADTVLESFLTANYPAINRLLLKTRQDE